jgi:aspartate/methionine/tyrosine aminotransferase
VISDEIYRRIAYDGPAAGLFSVARSRERIVVIDGMAKSFAMTGWRIGWAIANDVVAKTMTALQSHTTSNATTVAQYAALEALKRRDEAEAAIAAMVGEYRRRRDAALEVLRKPNGPPVIEPDGAISMSRTRARTMRTPARCSRRNCWRNTELPSFLARHSRRRAGFGCPMRRRRRLWLKEFGASYAFDKK